MMAKFGMTLCALGIAEEMRDAGIASNTLWPRTLVATAAVQNLLGGDEAMARAREPQVYSDAAYGATTRECLTKLWRPLPVTLRIPLYSVSA
jgi:citronellol/citronellal dehydrogenase